MELVPSIETSSGVVAIKRFISRQGTPSVIWSDNGNNFVGAEKASDLQAKNGTQKFHSHLCTKALSRSIIHQVRHIKVEHGNEWFADVSSCFTRP